MNRLPTMLTALAFVGPVCAGVTPIRGELDAPLDQAVGSGDTARLTGDTKTLGHGTDAHAEVDLNGFVFEINTGGGNKQTYRGAFTGGGTLRVLGRADASWWQQGDVWLAGTDANRLDRVRVVHGSVNLAKPAGVDALSGTITLGSDNPAHAAILAWNADHQINDASSIRSGGSTFELKMRGFSETLGTIAINGPGYLDFGGEGGTVRFANSSGQAWGDGASLLIEHWAGSTQNRLFFGADASGLTAEQVAQVGFIDPAGHDAGLYRAKMLASGALVPGEIVEPVNPPFELSDSATAQREALYQVTGRARLAGVDTPLKAGTKISVFGDSITWQDKYITHIQTALDHGPGSARLGVTLINRGINGGGVMQVRDGSADAAYPGTSAQEGFARTIAADQADIAVVLIGINDLWWRGTTEAAFRAGLEDIADQARAANVKLVFATPTVRFEKPDGSNGDDAAIDAFAQIMREVAAKTGAALVDLRAAYIAYEMNHNRALQLDGSLLFQETGVLTYDGVHPNAAGNELLADLIAQGIAEAAAAEPASRPPG